METAAERTAPRAAGGTVPGPSGRLARLEPVLNAVWAALTAALAVAVLWREDAFGRPEALAFFGLHLEAAALFLVRRRPRAWSRSPAAYAVALLSAGYFLAFDLDPALGGPLAPAGRAVLLAGCALCAAALASLGRSFGVLPAQRGVATNGLYRLVRHPLYAAYVVMDAGFLLLHPSPRNVVVLLAGLALYTLRIEGEERVLARAAAWRAYRRRVRWRLVPGLW